MINEKIYEQTYPDLELILNSEQVSELVRNNQSFQEYVVRDWVLIWEYEVDKMPAQSHSGVIFEKLSGIIGSTAAPEALAAQHPVNETDALTNHKLLKQTLYKHLSLTINDLRTQQESKYITPAEAAVEGVTVDTSAAKPESEEGVAVATAVAPAPVATKQKQSAFKEFFRKPDVNVYNFKTPEQLKKLNLEDKFFHARKTQPWCKQLKHQLFMIYLWPHRSKSKAKVVKTKFIKSFNEAYGTHYQLVNIDSEFNRLYNRFIDGKAYKDAVRVWIAAVGIPFVIIVLGCSIGIPLHSGH